LCEGARFSHFGPCMPHDASPAVSSAMAHVSGAPASRPTNEIVAVLVCAAAASGTHADVTAARRLRPTPKVVPVTVPALDACALPCAKRLLRHRIPRAVVVAALAASAGASIAAAGVARSAHEITARRVLAASAAWGGTDVAAAARPCPTEERGFMAVRASGVRLACAGGIAGYRVLAVAGAIAALASRRSARASATSVAHRAPETVARAILAASSPRSDANVTATLSTARKRDVEAIAAVCRVRSCVEARFQ